MAASSLMTPVTPWPSTASSTRSSFTGQVITRSTSSWSSATTSATLRAGGDWDVAEARSGAQHLLHPATRFEAQSPFDYAARSEVIIVTDVKRGDMAALANAYARLIVAANGGTLGLFTAIRRLRGVHARIADRLAREGLPLYAQHVDPIDTGTLVDIFRDDPRAFATDTAACALAKRAIDRGVDSRVDPLMRQFVYMPLMHAEDMADQEHCCVLFRAAGEPDNVKYADIHADIIRRFGRFPHRNAVLGRATTAEEQAFATPPSTELISVTCGLVGPTMATYGTPEQRERFATPFLRSDLLCCQLFSEPGAGSDLAASATRAVRTDDGWTIDGQKVWSSGARFADYGLLLARTDPSSPKHAGISYLLADMDRFTAPSEMA